MMAARWRVIGAGSGDEGTFAFVGPVRAPEPLGRVAPLPPGKEGSAAPDTCLERRPRQRSSFHAREIDPNGREHFLGRHGPDGFDPPEGLKPVLCERVTH